MAGAGRAMMAVSVMTRLVSAGPCWFWTIVIVLARIGKADPMMRKVSATPAIQGFLPREKRGYRLGRRQSGVGGSCVGETRKQPTGLADLLLWFGLVDDGIVLQRDGSLLAAWQYRGPDLQSATHAEMRRLRGD